MEKTVEIPVFGMSCQHCVKAVTDALGAHNAVKSVTVSLENKNARVAFDDDMASVPDFEAIIVEEGFTLQD
jgi:copper ion binding protein